MDDGQRSFYGLSRPPFGPVTAPADFFRSYYLGGLIDTLTGTVIEGRAITAIQGAHGVGKTSVLPVLAGALQTRGCTTAALDGVTATPRSVLRVLGGAAGCLAPDPAFADILHSWREGGRYRIVLLVDDAEALSTDCCRTLWEMLAACRAQAVGLHLVLLGDLGPWTGLQDPGLTEMRDAALPRYMIRCLSEEEAPQYLDYRLRQAGGSLRDVMTKAATAELLTRTGCNPQHLNAAAARALALGYRARRRRIDVDVLRQALSPGYGWAGAGASRRLVVQWGAGAVAAAALVGLAGYAGWRSAVPRHAGAMEEAAVAPRPRVAGGLIAIAPAPAPDRPVPRPAAPDRASAASVVDADHAVGRPSALATAQPQTAANPAARAVHTGSAAPPALAPAAPDTAAALVENGVALAPVPMAAAQSGPGLVLVAGAGDTMAKLYRRVYRGLVPPAYLIKAATDTRPITPGALVVFPAPPQGWKAQAAR